MSVGFDPSWEERYFIKNCNQSTMTTLRQTSHPLLTATPVDASHSVNHLFSCVSFLVVLFTDEFRSSIKRTTDTDTTIAANNGAPFFYSLWHSLEYFINDIERKEKESGEIDSDQY